DGLLPPRADEEGPGAVEARAKDTMGMAHFQPEEYGQGIALWERGFRGKPHPELLYWIAEAHREWKHPAEALAFYRRYLKLAPRARNRAEVKRKIAALEKSWGQAPTDGYARSSLLAAAAPRAVWLAPRLLRRALRRHEFM